jgi:hypothetical protein
MTIISSNQEVFYYLFSFRYLLPFVKKGMLDGYLRILLFTLSKLVV